jgi:hypothetical protein
MVSLSGTDQSETIICSTPASLNPRLSPKVPSDVNKSFINFLGYKYDQN